MRFTRLQSAALAQIHPYDSLRIEPQTGKIMFTKTFSLRAVVLLAALVAFAFAPQAKAQRDYGAVHGTVTDSSGAVIANASITVLNTATGIKTAARSDK